MSKSKRRRLRKRENKKKREDEKKKQKANEVIQFLSNIILRPLLNSTH